MCIFFSNNIGYTQMSPEDLIAYKSTLLSETERIGRFISKMALAKKAKAEGADVDSLPYCLKLEQNSFSKSTDVIFHQFEGFESPNPYTACSFYQGLLNQPYDEILIVWRVIGDSVFFSQPVSNESGEKAYPRCRVVIHEKYHCYKNGVEVYGHTVYKSVNFRIYESGPDTVKMVKCIGITSSRPVVWKTDKTTPEPEKDEDPLSSDVDDDGISNDVDLCPYQYGHAKFCGCPKKPKFPSRLTTLVPSLGNHHLNRANKAYWAWAGMVVSSYGFSTYYFIRFKESFPNCCDIPPEPSDVSGWDKYRTARLYRQNALTFAGIGTGIWIANIIQTNVQYSYQEKLRGCNPKEYKAYEIGIFEAPNQNRFLYQPDPMPSLSLLTIRWNLNPTSSNGIDFIP